VRNVSKPQNRGNAPVTFLNTLSASYKFIQILCQVIFMPFHPFIFASKQKNKQKQSLFTSKITVSEKNASPVQAAYMIFEVGTRILTKVHYITELTWPCILYSQS